MKKILENYLTAPMLTGLILSVFVLYACGEKAQDNKQSKTEYTDTISVEAVDVQLQELVLSKTFSSTLEGEEQANMFQNCRKDNENKCKSWRLCKNR